MFLSNFHSTALDYNFSYFHSTVHRNSRHFGFGQRWNRSRATSRRELCCTRSIARFVQQDLLVHRTKGRSIRPPSRARSCLSCSSRCSLRTSRALWPLRAWLVRTEHRENSTRNRQPTQQARLNTPLERQQVAHSNSQ